MPSYDEVKLVYYRSETGLMFLMACVAYALFALHFLMRRHPAFATRIRKVAPLAVPASIAIVNPVFAVILLLLGAAGAGFLMPIGVLFIVLFLFVMFTITMPFRKNYGWVANDWVDKLANLSLSPLPLILLGALLLRIPLLGQSLWYDESFSLRMAQLPLSMWPGAVINDVHPPLFYFAVWVWHTFTGESAPLLRALPLAFGILHIYLVYRLSQSLRLPKAASLAAAAIAAVLPAHVYYSTELRNYTMLACLYTAGAIAVMERRRWLLIFCMGVAPALHNFGLLYAGLLGISYLWMNGRAGLKPVIFGGIIGAPWALLAVAQSGIIADGYFPYITVGAVFWPLLQMTILMVNDSYVFGTFIPILAVTFSAVWAKREWLLNDPRGRIITLLIIGAPLIVAAVSFAWRPIYVSRTFFPAMMLMPIVWGAFLYNRPTWKVITAGALAFSLFVFFADGSSNTRLNYAAMIEQDCAPGLPVYATSIPAAFVIHANSDRLLTVWDQSTDDAGTFTSDDLYVYGFNVSSTPPDVPRYCILQIDQPLSAQSEREYVDWLTGIYYTETTRHSVSRWHTVYVHEVG